MRNCLPLLAAGLMLGTPLPVPAQGAPALDDAAIVGIFDAANAWDVSTGALASTKGSTRDVREFGAMLARDHKILQQQGRELAAKLGVTPTAVPAEFALRKEYDAAMRKLGGLSGKAFDRAFLEYEVAYHKAVIDAVTGQLLPAIRNAELKAFVEKVAPAFDGHMRAAQTQLARLSR